ncbi:hypothetical protein AGLY_006764 [Aphis glycines]|uniref:Uncharacterized protein n=1 Tax=Aphis glycines TaxID=307491 RepID=A0A6G0TSI3_APHGL|nr:hypothetical protein AGLY_006764 [Aphis glycines]
MWSLIKIIDMDDVTYYDVVPNKWIVNDKHCLYSVARVSTIKKLAKENTDCKDDWEVFNMVIIEQDIRKGYKMMIKANKKQSESNLDSEFEIRGKGCRKKTTSSKQLFEISSSDEDIAVDNNDPHPSTSSIENLGLQTRLPVNIERQFPTPPLVLLKSATKRTFNSISTLSPSTSSSRAVMSTLVEGDKSCKHVCPLIGTRYSKNEHRCSSSDLCFISGELKILNCQVFIFFKVINFNCTIIAADIMKLRNTVSYIKHHLIDNKDTTDDKKTVVVSNYEMENIFPIKSEDGLKMCNQHKFPTTTKAGIIEFISPWMAQSETRIKRHTYIFISSLTTSAIDDDLATCSDQLI